MEKIKGLAIELDLDHLSVDRGLKGLKDNLKTVNAEMRRNMSAFDMSDRSVAKYETRLTGLNKKLEVQKQAVAEAKKEYEAMVDQYGRGTKEAESAAREYNNQAASLNNLERYIEKTKNELADFEKHQRIANSNWTKLGDKLEGASNKFRSISETTGKVGSSLTNKITKPAAIAATAVGGLVSVLGWKRLVGLDTAKAQLKGLGYEGKDVDRIMEQVTSAIDGGMTTAAEGTAIAAGALAAGVKEGKDLEKYIKLVGDAAVGANRPVGDMAQIFNRVQGSGKLMTQELNMIEQSMPGFAQAMADNLAGGSLESFRKMVTNGEVGSKDFLKVMDSFAGNMAKSYSESWEGMVKNTLAYVGIIGENLLSGVFQKSKEEIADFIEVLKSDAVLEWAEKSGVAIGNTFREILDKVRDLKSRYDELTPAQQEFVNKVLLIAPAVAVGIGPALTLFSKLTLGVSGVLSVAGKLSKAIGVARGAGLAAGLASLGPLAIGGLAIAGLSAVGIAAYEMHKKSKAAEQVNLDLAESLSDEAIELENAANTFDKLSGKAKISNEQLAELNDLNKRISESSNPGEIKELKDQYNALAKESGLSKDELKRLFEANSNIIGQSPDVEKSVSDQGNEFVKSTDAVKEYVQSLYEMSRQELSDEMVIAEQKKQDILNENKGIKEDIAALDDRSQELRKLEVMSETERNDYLREWHREIQQQMVRHKDDQDKFNELKKEEEIVNGYINNGLATGLKKIQDQRDELNEKVDKNQEELDKINSLNAEMANIILKQAGINEEGEKGLAALDKSLVKNDEELIKLEAKRKKNGELTEKEQERYDKLVETNSKQIEAKEYLNDELGIYKDINSLAELKISKLDKEGQKRVENLAKAIDIKAEEGNIVKQIDKKNSKLLEERGNLEENRKKNGANKKEIDGQIASLDTKISKNASVKKQLLQELGVWDNLDSKIKEGINKEIEKGNAVDNTKGKLQGQGGQIDNNNSKTSKGIGLEEARTKEAGKDVNKNVAVKDNGTIDTLNMRATAPKSKSVAIKDNGTINTLNLGATAPKTKKVNLTAGSTLSSLNRMASSPVSKVINFVGKGMSKLKFWAKGTPPGGHPEDGPAVVGDGGGRELITLPSGKSFLSPDTDTLLNLPKGTDVIPHRETARLLKSVKHYAGGTKDYKNSDFMKLLALNGKDNKTEIKIKTERAASNVKDYTKELLEATLQQNQILLKLLKKDNNVYLDSDMMTNKVNEKNAVNASLNYF